jgi:hypothetical protein
MNATMFLDLVEQVTIPEDGTISRTLYQDSGLKVVVFGICSRAGIVGAYVFFASHLAFHPGRSAGDAGNR